MNVTCAECRTVFRVDPDRVPDPGVRARCSVCGGVIAISTDRGWDDDFANVAPSTVARESHQVGRVAALAPSDSATPASSAIARESVADVTRAPAPAPEPVAAYPTPVVPLTPVAPPTPVAPEPARDSASRVGAAPPGARAPIASPARASRPTPPRVPPFSPGRRMAPPATGGVSARAATSARPVDRERRVPSPAEPARVPATPASTVTPAATLVADHATPSASGSSGATRRPINPFLANDPNAKARRLARALVSDMIAYHPAKHEEGLRAGSLKQLFREEIRKSYEEYVDQVGQEFAETTTHFQDALNDVLAGGKKIF